ncbi:Ribosomal RNA small subunit methyltransferase G [Candidatus Cyrtobacter comes]|uniref:Ribosomal RNA small subunit methyltransferase G n=1 Tax=Candidatus Cyrtobacter comes TaxID=675776 RepID=A0ABU5L8E0_9RICK|nr:RsmG family class I SAM-dependent methyltransferase [Candidatus Cyrtobacter comes]MDZ5762322.1 Ribosomal RNA small subunit methyltransferase G [Candidatus Cyrtobacter comes]
MLKKDIYERICKNVSRETFEKILCYEKLLNKWNGKINLISRKMSEEEILKNHIAQSIELSKLIPGNMNILDVGSGAGFPGMILAILGFTVCLSEINIKKASFLNFVKSELEVNVTVENCCVSKLRGKNFNCIVSRSVTNVKNLLELTKEAAANDVTYMVYAPKDTNFREIKNNYAIYMLTIGNDYVNNRSIAMLKSINAH